MIDVVFVCTADERYSYYRDHPIYLKTLMSMLDRHLGVDARFHCITNFDPLLEPRVHRIELPSSQVLPGHWNKLHLFNPSLHGLDGPILFLDLDVTVLKSLTPFVRYGSPTDLCMIQGDLVSGNSNVIRMMPSHYQFVWDEFQKRELAEVEQLLEREGVLNDDGWIYYALKSRGMLVTKYPKRWAVKFERVLSGEERVRWWTRMVLHPAGSKQLNHPDHPIVEKHWR